MSVSDESPAHIIGDGVASYKSIRRVGIEALVMGENPYQSPQSAPERRPSNREPTYYPAEAKFVILLAVGMLIGVVIVMAMLAVAPLLQAQSGPSMACRYSTF